MDRGPRLPQYQKHSPIVKLPFLQQEEHHGATKVPTRDNQSCSIPFATSYLCFPEHTF